MTARRSPPTTSSSRFAAFSRTRNPSSTRSSPVWCDASNRASPASSRSKPSSRRHSRAAGFRLHPPAETPRDPGRRRVLPPSRRDGPVSIRGLAPGRPRRLSLASTATGAGGRRWPRWSFAPWPNRKRGGPSSSGSGRSSARGPRRGWEEHHGNPRLTLIARPSLSVSYLGINVTPGPDNLLADLRVRQAIRLAIDLKKLLLRGRPTTLFPPASTSP